MPDLPHPLNDDLADWIPLNPRRTMRQMNGPRRTTLRKRVFGIVAQEESESFWN